MNIAAIWIIIGIVLLIAEMLTGTFVLIFFSLGAFLSALVASFAPDVISVQLLTGAVVAIAGALVLRKPLQQRLLKTSPVIMDIGKEIVIDQRIAPHQQTRISYQGTTWQATNVGTETINVGDRAAIVGKENLTLLLKKN